MTFSVEFIKSLLKQSTLVEEQNLINEDLFPLLLDGNISFVRKLSCMLLLAEQHDAINESSIAQIKNNWRKILSIVEEHNIYLPEAEIAIETALKAIQEEGESAAPANVTAGIDASTPRIDPKIMKKRKEDKQSSVILP
jgi:hypothetical protein